MQQVSQQSRSQMDCLSPQLDVHGSPIDSRLAPKGFRGTGQPIKVCFISPLGYGLYRPDSGYPFGGSEVQFYLLSKALSEDPTFQVSVLTTVSEESGREQRGRLTVIKRKGQARLSSPRGATRQSLFKILQRYGAAFWEMRDLFREIDADVYLHAGAGVEVGAYALICRLLRRRFVYVVASSADLSDANGYVPGPLRWLFPLGLRLADAVICRSYDQLEHLKVGYHRDGVLIRTGHPVPQGTTTPKSTVLWVGRMHPIKQPLMFLDLVERCPRERYVMVGMRDRTHENLWQEVHDRAARLASVSLYEDVPLSDVERHFSRAKVFINTSQYEGFPNTFVQAAMQGVPIVSLQIDPDGVLSRHGIGICTGGAFDGLVAATKMLCEQEDRRRELSQRAAAYALKHHDLDRSVEALKQLIRKLVPLRTAAC